MKKIFIPVMLCALLLCFAISAPALAVTTNNNNAYTVWFERNTNVSDAYAFDIKLTRGAGTDDVSLLAVTLNVTAEPSECMSECGTVFEKGEGTLRLTLNRLADPLEVGGKVGDSVTLGTVSFTASAAITYTGTNMDGITNSGYAEEARMTVTPPAPASLSVSAARTDSGSESTLTVTYSTTYSGDKLTTFADGVWLVASSYVGGKMTCLRMQYVEFTQENSLTLTDTISLSSAGADAEVCLYTLGGDATGTNICALLPANNVTA